MLRYEEKPCHFAGTSIDVVDYFVHFETVSFWNGWSEIEKACQLIINMRGEAQTILRFLSDSQKKDFDYLKNLLVQKFNPKERVAYFKVELQRCCKQERESVSKFGNRLKKLAFKAYEDSFHDLDVYIVDLFISKLDTDMGKFIQFKHPASLDIAISFALEFETVNSDSIEQKVDVPDGKVKGLDSDDINIVLAHIVK